MSRTRKIVLETALATLLLGGSALVLPIVISPGHADSARVVSIKETRDYQDPVLLKKAWALPVAAAYRADIEFQLVLVLDVNKKYGPWLVKSDRLYEAMNTVDATAQKKRGLLLIE
jgi:hypothetical protein